MTEVIFLQVRNSHEKLSKVIGAIKESFNKRQKVLIKVPNMAAAEFIDEALWRPEESFLPHIITDHPSKEHVVITTQEKNLNEASVLVHLCPEPSHIAPGFEKVYDLHDQTSAPRAELSKKRFEAYRKIC